MESVHESRENAEQETLHVGEDTSIEDPDRGLVEAGRAKVSRQSLQCRFVSSSCGICVSERGALAFLFALAFVQGLSLAGILPASLTAIEDDFHLSKTQLGALPSMYDIGNALFNPVAGHAQEVFPIPKIVATGFAAYLLCSAGMGLSPTYGILVSFVLLSGVFGAPLYALAGPYFDDNVHETKLSKFVSTFLCAGPIGSSIGYAVGGILADVWTWRASFVIIGVAALPLCLWFFFFPRRVPNAPPIPQRISDLNARKDQAALSFKDGLKLLLRNRTFMALCFGQGLYGFVVNGLTNFLPFYVEEKFSRSKSVAGTIVGAVVIPAAVLGTLAGGFVLRRLGRVTARSSLAICVFSTAIPAVFSPGLFMAKDLGVFAGVCGVLMLIAFGISTPAQTAVLRTVEPDLRCLAQGVNLAMYRILGTIPGPLVLGVLLDATDDDLFTSFTVCTAIPLALTSGFYAIAWILARRLPDFSHLRVHEIDTRAEAASEPVELTQTESGTLPFISSMN